MSNSSSLNKIPMSKILNERLRGENLSRIARQIGISKSVLSDWVAARRVPSLKNIEQVAKLADYLGLSLDQLLLGRSTQGQVVGSVQIQDGDRSYKIVVSKTD